MLVKVVKSSGRGYWYANEIGKIFEVFSEPQLLSENPMEDQDKKYYMLLNRMKYFDIDDVEVIANPLAG